MTGERWHAGHIGTDDFRRECVFDANGGQVCEVTDASDKAPAIAALLAAAPLLLSALEAMARTLADLGTFRDKDGTLRIVNDSGDRIAYAGAIIDERVVAARAAIASATVPA